MNRRKLFWYSSIGLLLLIQFYPVERPEVIIDNPGDLLVNNKVPEEISSMLRSACYDCHSNETNYPWYSYIAPVKWMVSDHVEEGRDELNFSDWETLSKMDKAEALDDIATEVTEGEMPLKYYPLTHANAKLSETDRQAISDWAEALAEDLFE